MVRNAPHILVQTCLSSAPLVGLQSISQYLENLCSSSVYS